MTQEKWGGVLPSIWVKTWPGGEGAYNSMHFWSRESAWEVTKEGAMVLTSMSSMTASGDRGLLEMNLNWGARGRGRYDLLSKLDDII